MTMLLSQAILFFDLQIISCTNMIRRKKLVYTRIFFYYSAFRNEFSIRAIFYKKYLNRHLIKMGMYLRIQI